MKPYSRTGRIKTPRKFNRVTDDQRIDKRDVIIERDNTVELFEAKKVYQVEEV